MEMEIDGSNSGDDDLFNLTPPSGRKTVKNRILNIFGIDNKRKSNVSKRPRKPRANIRRPNTVKMTKLHGTEISYTDDVRLGQGATSIVYKGYYGEVPCAVKRVDSKYVDISINELSIWQHMKKKTENANVNIVSLLRWIEWEEGNGTTYYFAMELALCDLGKRVQQLQEWKATEDPQFEVQAKKLPQFLYEAAKGLLWMHEARVFHRDIKPENVLIFETSTGEIAKLGDFGISRKLSATSTGTNSAGKGTSDWMAPEALHAMIHETKLYTRKLLDIFSLGMTSHYAISLGSHPFDYVSQFGRFITMNIKEDSVLPVKLGYPHLAADHLFQWMMKKNENERPKILVVTHHPFYWDWVQNKDFLLAVARCFDSKKDGALLTIRKEVDNTYKSTISRLTNGVSNNWLKRLGPRLESLLSQRKNSKGIKKYDGDSIMMLVELIRDKYMHYTDMVDELTTSDSYFGGRKKELVVLRNNFYAHFNTVPAILPVNPHISREFYVKYTEVH